MSALKLTARFRIKNGIPFAIETLSGRQYRCGNCGKVFFNRKELDSHLLNESKKTIFNFPELNKNISITVIYSQDVRERTNPSYPKLKKGEKLFKLKEK